MSDTIKHEPIADWRLFQRVNEVESAYRMNFIRAAGLALFYSVHQYTYLQAGEDEAILAYHHWVSISCLAWLLLAIAIFCLLATRSFPALAKYIVTIADVALLTGIGLAGQQAESGVVVIYFLIIAMTYLCFSPPLTIVATASSIFGYMLLVGASDPVWFDTDHVIPLAQQGVMLVALLLTGAVGWQLAQLSRRWFDSQAKLAMMRSAIETPTSEGE